MQNAYSAPTLVSFGSLAALTGNDAQQQATDINYGPDGSDLGNSTGSPSSFGCVDTPPNGVCDYEEQV